jgi:hypothetical protein
MVLIYLEKSGKAEANRALQARKKTARFSYNLKNPSIGVEVRQLFSGSFA